MNRFWSLLQIETKRIYDSPSEEDGFRLLVMRRWPRGVAKNAVDAWEKELGPSEPLLTGFRSGEIDWDEYRERYLEEIARKADLIEWVRQKTRRGRVTLLCGCRIEERCHRSLLKALVLDEK